MANNSTVTLVKGNFSQIKPPEGVSQLVMGIDLDNSLKLMDYLGNIYTYNGTNSTAYSGPQGFQGVIGTGATGPQGIVGVQGLTGPQGPLGIQGVQGFAGSNGSNGFQGPQGLQGPQGNQGFQGINGVQGNQGNQGAIGIGNQGTMGFQGWQGVQGLVSGTGSQGFQGRQGWQGFQGNTGTNGVQGFQGTAGTNGTQGNQGPIGFQGFQGTIPSIATASDVKFTDVGSSASVANLHALTIRANSMSTNGDYAEGQFIVTYNLGSDLSGSSFALNGNVYFTPDPQPAPGTFSMRYNYTFVRDGSTTAKMIINMDGLTPNIYSLTSVNYTIDNILSVRGRDINGVLNGLIVVNLSTMKVVKYNP